MTTVALAEVEISTLCFQKNLNEKETLSIKSPWHKSFWLSIFPKLYSCPHSSSQDSGSPVLVLGILEPSEYSLEALVQKQIHPASVKNVGIRVSLP